MFDVKDLTQVVSVLRKAYFFIDYYMKLKTLCMAGFGFFPVN